ncbi:MAG: M3 family oligoendopeptidase [Chloroflexota bacterium]
MSTSTELPRWDMEIVYPGLESPEFKDSFDSLRSDLDGLASLFARFGIGSPDPSNGHIDAVRAFEAIVDALNKLLERYTTVQAYVYAFVSTDSRDNVAQARYSELQQLGVNLAQLEVRFTAWIGKLDLESLRSQSATARDLGFMLEKAQVQARHLMSPAEEELAAELEVTGGSAWTQLHHNVSSQLMVDVEHAGERPVPMTVVRNMAFHKDRQVRRQGYEAELGAWQGVSVTLAAALNSIKGETNTLHRRRGWSHPLDAAVFGNNIDRETLEAMLSAARDAFPDFQRYLRAKARALNLERLAWYDLFASVGESTRIWDYEHATRFIVEQFATYSSRLSDFAARAFRDGWIDAGPRPGKSGGAFCMPLRADESRILANYTPSYDGMSTLAHELGHGYHNLNLAHRPPLLRGHPMTLAETASIFCQTIVEHAALREAAAQERMAIIESSLQDTCQVVVDITSRYLFECGVFERRQQRELSVDELNALMLDAQRQTYGDSIDQDLLHPYMWAVKGHYYGPLFYNYPYMFGLLFGLGLYAQYLQDPDGFRDRYDELLAATGTADAASLASRFGIDIRGKEFWTGSLDVIRGQVGQFERLVAETA